MEEKIFTLDDLAGRQLKVKISPLAEQANSSALVQHGETTVLVTTMMAKEDREGVDFFPLVVDYEERFYAAGKIIGSRFIRREGRPSEAAILTGRMIDRPIRPLFDQKMRREVQIVVTVLSIDNDNDPDFSGLLGASIALGISDIPWNGPVAGIRISKIGEKFIINPTYTEREQGEFDVFVSGTDDKINMLEISAKEIPEEIILKAVELGVEYIKKLNQFQKEIFKAINAKKTTVLLKEPAPELKEKVKGFLKDKLEEAIYTKDKMTRQTKLDALKEKMKEWLLKEKVEEENWKEAFSVLEEEIDHLVHQNILNKEKRPDGRRLNEIRPISCEVGILPRVHGSALFIRGNTQALSSVTLAAPSKELTIETMETSGSKRFLHHYNFPPFSVGEIRPMRGPGRREIGHGALAEKSLIPIIPNKDQFPYTIRVVSEILSSNGSSSMASVSGSSLALMDAGVPIKTPASGIAMGLMMENESNYKILTDIQGPEDHYGDMDLKVAGTKNGITGAQMDVKMKGVGLKILREVFEEAKTSRREILGKMISVLSGPRSQISPYAPKIYTLQINPEKIREVIGSGGKTINAIIEKTGAEIDIEDSGLIYVTALSDEAAKKALEIIKAITYEFQIGEIVEGKIIKILEFGAIVDIGFNRSGLLHISELAPRRVEKVEDVVKIGDVIKVKVIKLGEEGKIGLSLKALTSPPQNNKNNYSKNYRK